MVKFKTFKINGTEDQTFNLNDFKISVGDSKVRNVRNDLYALVLKNI